MSDDDTINVPIQARSHELNQLHEFVPTVIEQLERADLDERVEDVRSIYSDHIDITHETSDEPAFVTYLSMPSESWTTLIRELHRIDDGRVWWLRTKFARRVRQRLEGVGS